MFTKILNVMSLIKASESEPSNSNSVFFNNKITIYAVSKEMEEEKNEKNVVYYQTPEIFKISTRNQEGELYCDPNLKLHVYMGFGLSDVTSPVELKSADLLYWGYFTCLDRVNKLLKKDFSGEVGVEVKQDNNEPTPMAFFNFYFSEERDSSDNIKENSGFHILTTYEDIKRFIMEKGKLIEDDSCIIAILSYKEESPILSISVSNLPTIEKHFFVKKPRTQNEDSWFKYLFKFSYMRCFILLLVVCFACAVVFYLIMGKGGQETEKLNDENSI